MHQKSKITSQPKNFQTRNTRDSEERAKREECKIIRRAAPILSIKLRADKEAFHIESLLKSERKRARNRI